MLDAEGEAILLEYFKGDEQMLAAFIAATRYLENLPKGDDEAYSYATMSFLIAGAMCFIGIEAGEGSTDKYMMDTFSKLASHTIGMINHDLSDVMEVQRVEV